MHCWMACQRQDHRQHRLNGLALLPRVCSVVFVFWNLNWKMLVVSNRGDGWGCRGSTREVGMSWGAFGIAGNCCCLSRSEPHGIFHSLAPRL